MVKVQRDHCLLGPRQVVQVNWIHHQVENAQLKLREVNLLFNPGTRQVEHVEHAQLKFQRQLQRQLNLLLNQAFLLSSSKK